MKYSPHKPALLILEDGTVFNGKAIGAKGTTTGEICFNTGMTGYQEIYTDPSYYGQILLATTTHIGNYGIHPDEVESDSLKIAGLVCKKFTDKYYSRPSAIMSLQELFEKEGLVGISDIDTRALVRHIRDKGAMNAIISSEELDIEKLKNKLKKVPSMKGLELSSKVSTSKPYYFGKQDSPYKVAVLDLGVKRNILRCLAERGCYLKVFPMNTPLDEMLQWEPDGFMLSNGPGDPSAMPGVVSTVKNMLATDIPVFGICLGHQVLALACGLSTYKMHNGHRGVNHPVKNLLTGKGEITSQNHGFVVSMDDAKKQAGIEITHIHLNDGTLAGIRLKDKKVFSVQYHPESSAGPNDSRYLFDEFIENIKQYVSEKEEQIA
jgi:carbamoyl-phosphate synthase small subunit